MVLFLDDDKNRIRAFRTIVPSAFIAEDAKQMINLLEKLKEPAKYVFLDHDLGGETFVDSSLANTGMVVVRWIQKYKPPIQKVFVHSFNYYAASIMISRLVESGYDASSMPFNISEIQQIFSKD